MTDALVPVAETSAVDAAAPAEARSAMAPAAASTPIALSRLNRAHAAGGAGGFRGVLRAPDRERADAGRVREGGRTVGGAVRGASPPARRSRRSPSTPTSERTPTSADRQARGRDPYALPRAAHATVRVVRVESNAGAAVPAPPHCWSTSWNCWATCSHAAPNRG